MLYHIHAHVLLFAFHISPRGLQRGQCFGLHNGRTRPASASGSAAASGEAMRKDRATEKQDTNMDYRSTVKTHARTTQFHMRILDLFGHIFSSTALVRFGKKVPNKHHEVAATWVNEAESWDKIPSVEAKVRQWSMLGLYVGGVCSKVMLASPLPPQIAMLMGVPDESSRMEI